MKFYNFFLLYVMTVNIVFSNVLKAPSHEKKEDNIRASIKAYFFISDSDKANEKIVLSDYIIDIDKDGVRFNSQDNKYILNYNEIQFQESHIFFPYEEVLNMDLCRKGFRNSLQLFAGLHQSFPENLKGFFILFRKLIQLNNGTEKLRMVYIHPVNITTLDARQNQLFFRLLQKKIFVNYSNQLTSDSKYWKYQNFGESDHLKLLHWSEYLSSNKLFYDNIFTTLQAEGIVINEEKSFNILTVKYTFRYDQIMNCDGEINDDLIRKINNENSERLSKNRCCVSYDINWGGYITTDLFCSKIQHEKGCKSEIEIFKKTILNKCVSIGVKQLFKSLSSFEFDFTSWIIKASSFDKIRFYNLFRILKENKILFFRNNYYFRDSKNYLDYFAPFFSKYAKLLELHGKGILKMLKENNAKKPDSDNSMTSFEDDAAEKVMENLNIQSIDNEMDEHMKQAVRKVVAQFPSFFLKVISHDMKLDPKMFEKYCIDNLDKNKDFYKHEIKKDLVSFVNNYNNNAKLKNEVDKFKNGNKCPLIDEKTKKELFEEIIKPNKTTEILNAVNDINTPRMVENGSIKDKNSNKNNSNSNTNPPNNQNPNKTNKENCQKDLIKMKKRTNIPKNHHKQNLHDLFHSNEDLNILKSFDKELINHPKNKLNIKPKDECEKEKGAVSPEERKKNFILEKIREQNMKNIANLINSKNFYMGIKACKEDLVPRKNGNEEPSGDDKENKTKDFLNKLKEKNMVPVDDSNEGCNEEVDPNKINDNRNGELKKFKKYFKGAIVPKDDQKPKCKKEKKEDVNNDTPQDPSKNNIEKDACGKLKNKENNDSSDMKPISDGGSSQMNNKNNFHPESNKGPNSQSNSNKNSYNGNNFIGDKSTHKTNPSSTEGDIGNSFPGNSKGKASDGCSRDARENISNDQKRNSMDQSSLKKLIESQIDSKLQEIKKSLMQLESDNKQISKKKLLRKLQSITKNLNNIQQRATMNPLNKSPIEIISKGNENLVKGNINNSSANVKDKSNDSPNSEKLAKLIQNLNENLVKINRKDSNSNSGGNQSENISVGNSATKESYNINNNIYTNHHYNANNGNNNANGQSDQNTKQNFLNEISDSLDKELSFNNKTDDDIIMEDILQKQREWQKEKEKNNEKLNPKSNDSNPNTQSKNSNSSKENPSYGERGSGRKEKEGGCNSKNNSKDKSENSNGDSPDAKKNNENGDKNSSNGKDSENNSSKNSNKSDDGGNNDFSKQKDNPNIPKIKENSSKNNNPSNKLNGRSYNDKDRNVKKNYEDPPKKLSNKIISDNPANNSTITRNNQKVNDSKNSTESIKNKKPLTNANNPNNNLKPKKEETKKSESEKENENCKINNSNDHKRIYNIMSSGFLPNQYPLHNMEIQLQLPFVPNPFAFQNNPIPNTQYFPNIPNLPFPPNQIIPENSIDFIQQNQTFLNSGIGMRNENQLNYNIQNYSNNGNLNRNYPSNWNSSNNINNYQAQNLNNAQQNQQGFLSNQQTNNYNNENFNNLDMNPPLFNSGF